VTQPARQASKSKVVNWGSISKGHTIQSRSFRAKPSEGPDDPGVAGWGRQLLTFVMRPSASLSGWADRSRLPFPMRSWTSALSESPTTRSEMVYGRIERRAGIGRRSTFNGCEVSASLCEGLDASHPRTLSKITRSLLQTRFFCWPSPLAGAALARSRSWRATQQSSPVIRASRVARQRWLWLPRAVLAGR